MLYFYMLIEIEIKVYKKSVSKEKESNKCWRGCEKLSFTASGNVNCYSHCEK